MHRLFFIFMVVLFFISAVAQPYLLASQLIEGGPGFSYNRESASIGSCGTYTGEMESPHRDIGLLKEHMLRSKDREVEVTISFAGDCTIGTDESFPYTDSFPHRLERQNNDYAYFFRGVRHIFEEDDLTLVNLEGTLTNADTAANKRFRFKGDPSYVNIFKAGDIEMVSISNNHIYDYGRQGFEDTLKALDGAGILYCGEGHIAYHRVKGVTIAVIGHTGWDTSVKKHLAADIREARGNADLVVVSFHWGQERSYHPDGTQKSLGRFCIDSGADVVVGHHPHVVQGIESYRDRFIVYSLGNFCFGGNRNPADKDSFIFQNTFTLENRRVVKSGGRVIPCSISSQTGVNDYQPTVLQGSEGLRVLHKIGMQGNGYLAPSSNLMREYSGRLE